jgi:predicted DNA-binding transcriptional regulator YafY
MMRVPGVGARQYLRRMNRTDRLYAIVEELRAVSPRRRSARELATRYEVSVRTIERDIDALQQAGVPIYADVGRRGGYAVDRSMTLPSLNFTPAEAVAVSVALSRVTGSPFDRAARSALHKIVSAMPARESAVAHDLANRVRLRSTDAAAPVPAVIADSLVARRVLRLDYEAWSGERTEREVEPLMFLSSERGWYLFAWCRLREDMRAFRVDRIRSVIDTGEPAPPRPAPELPPGIPEHLAIRLH